VTERRTELRRRGVAVPDGGCPVLSLERGPDRERTEDDRLDVDDGLVHDFLLGSRDRAAT